MGNAFLDPGPERAAKVRSLFATIASRYDLINDLQSFGLHRLWKQKLARLAALPPHALALDLCCGTGDITRALRFRGAYSIGLDFSRPMLERARQRAATFPPPLWIEGDALLLPFPDLSVDCVSIGYGLRNVAQIDRCLREIHRVLKPGGQFLILEFGKPLHPAWRAFYDAYLKVGVPFFGWLFFRNPDTYAYIFESLQQYPPPLQLSSMLEAHQFKVDLHLLLGGIMTIHHARKLAKNI